MKNKLIKLFILLSSFFIVIIIAALYTRELVTPDENRLKPSLSRYELKPTRAVDFSNIQLNYPYVSKKPGTAGYLFVDYVEKYQIYTNQKDRLFFINKRVSEIEKWRNEFKTIGGVDSISKLQNGSYPHGSWEYVFSSYYELMLEAIEFANIINEEFSDTRQLLEIQKHVIVHERDISDYLDDLKFKDNKYLWNLFHMVFSNLNSELSILSVEESSMEIRKFNTKLIHMNRDYGTYDILINRRPFGDNLSADTSPVLVISGKEIVDAGVGGTNFVYENIVIDKDIDEILLSHKLRNSIVQIDSTENLPGNCIVTINEDISDGQSYLLDIEEISGNYFMNIKLKSPAEIFEILIFSLKGDECVTSSRKTLSGQVLGEITIGLNVDDGETDEYQLVFDSSVEVKIEEIILAKEIYPTLILQKQHRDWKPKMRAEQVDQRKYEIIVENANSYQVDQLGSIINFPYKVTSEAYNEERGFILEVSNSIDLKWVAFVVFTSTTVYLVRKKLWNFVTDNLKRSYSKLRLLSVWLQQLDGNKVFLAFGLLTLGISVVDIFYISSTLDPIFIVPIIILFTISLIYRLASKFLIIPGLAYFVLSVIMYLLDIGNFIGGPVDKATFWSYYFLLFGTLLMIVRSATQFYSEDK